MKRADWAAASRFGLRLDLGVALRGMAQYYAYAALVKRWKLCCLGAAAYGCEPSIVRYAGWILAANFDAATTRKARTVLDHAKAAESIEIEIEAERHSGESLAGDELRITRRVHGARELRFARSGVGASADVRGSITTLARVVYPCYPNRTCASALSRTAGLKRRRGCNLRRFAFLSRAAEIINALKGEDYWAEDTELKLEFFSFRRK